MDTHKESKKNRFLVALEGDLGENVPCYVFNKIIKTSHPVEGQHRRMRLRLPLDEAIVHAYDGTWGIIEAREQNGPTAYFHMHRIHMQSLGIDTEIKNIDNLPRLATEYAEPKKIVKHENNYPENFNQNDLIESYTHPVHEQNIVNHYHIQQANFGNVTPTESSEKDHKKDKIIFGLSGIIIGVFSILLTRATLPSSDK